MPVGHGGDRELARAPSIAGASATELQYQLLVATDLGYLRAEAHHDLDDRVAEVGRMLYRLIKTLS